MLLIGGFYLVPQLKGAGLALNVVTGSPYWVGVLIVGAIVAINVAIGGMRGITYVQAFQFWVKVFAISVPVIVLLIHFGGLPERSALFGAEYPHVRAGGAEVTLTAPSKLEFPVSGDLSAERQNLLGQRRAAGVAARRVLRLPADSVAPVASGIVPLRGNEWSRPVGGSAESAPLLVYSLLLATFLGTMGLPHILVRFYTNPDGTTARHTTVRVLGLLSMFYLFPAFYGALGRALAPQLYTTGQTDDVVLTLPRTAWPGTVGTLLTALTCAGAFAAFLSTSSGLCVSLAGTISHDVWPRLARERSKGVAQRRWRFRVAAVGSMVIPVVFALYARSIDISILVGWAFAIAASTFCPMFLLGIWWTRLTARGRPPACSSGCWWRPR